ncbi:DegT/DnrJ/EryC1/StrS family aminotransferase [Cohnella sp. GCM10027633]|uniref:DegT/DnrJ/EryC1/StrS family aminotransferase n=1 Tax=unclassified Cohnella TaxID=2636738 RepID=UPI00363F22FA
MNRFYPMSIPRLDGNEAKYVMDCLQSTWISSNGSYIEKFERAFADFCGAKHAISCSNGTTALHLALLAHGVGRGDEVLVPTLTFVATANAVAYCGATPVFVDAEPATWNLDPSLLERYITPRTKGIIPVHLYGHPADMDPIRQLADKYGLFVVEDAAEAIGARYKGKTVGSIGDCATFSLFGNKTITTGEGGLVTTDNDELAGTIRQLKGQGQDPRRRYWFPVVGYNYRMTNVQAAIGLAQMERIDWHVEERIRIANRYASKLENDPRLQLPVEMEWARNAYWMYGVVLRGTDAALRDDVMRRMFEKGVETRPFFYPMHALPPYEAGQPNDRYPVADRISSQGFNLPTYGGLSEEDIDDIVAKLLETLDEMLPV